MFEQLLLGAYRAKASTVHPRSLHVHYGLVHLDYDGRKRATERIAARVLSEYGIGGRSHDVADAVCVMGFALHERAVAARRRAAAVRVASLEQYRFTGTVVRKRRL